MLTQQILIVFAIVAFLVGYIAQDILYTFGIMVTGTLATCLVLPYIRLH